MAGKNGPEKYGYVLFTPRQACLRPSAREGVFGIKAAVDDINEQGGVNVGRGKLPIELMVVNNESDPNKAGSLAESLTVQDKVNFICSGDEPPPMHAVCRIWRTGTRFPMSLQSGRLSLGLG